MAAQRITSRTKVYITRIGMKDWLVAATSQKAALAAWDVHRNLFAAGEARVTNDPAHVELAMRTPGVAVPAPGGASSADIVDLSTRRRAAGKGAGSNVVNLAAHRRASGGAEGGKGAAKTEGRRAAKPALAPKPQKPDRSKLDAAERDLRAYERETARVRAEIEKRRRSIETELEAFDAESERHRQRLAKRITREREALDES